MLLADDHLPTRDEIALTLEFGGGFEICAEAADAAGAVAAAVREQPDVCVLDVNMPGGGVAAAREIAARVPSAKVVMLTVSLEDCDVIAAREAGAAGYIAKGIDVGTLEQALHAIHAGDDARFLAVP